MNTKPACSPRADRAVELPPAHYPIKIWCTLVMLDTAYVAGALALARSLKKVHTKYQVWCMVDPSIPQNARDLLAKEFTHVVEVNIIEHDTVPLKSEILQERRGAWSNRSFTKWNVLNPETFTVSGLMYNIVAAMFLDADMVFLKNCDHLMDMPTPAAMFASAWSRPYGTAPISYGELKHGQAVDKRKIQKALGGSHLCNAGMVLLRPTGWLWETFLKILNASPVYGYPECKATPDEQILVDCMAAVGATFHAIHQQYNWPVGKSNLFIHNEIPEIYHFQGPKPWVNPDSIASVEEKTKAIGNRRLGYYIPWERIARELLEDHADFHNYVADSPMLAISGSRHIPDTPAGMSNVPKHRTESVIIPSPTVLRMTDKRALEKTNDMPGVMVGSQSPPGVPDNSLQPITA